MNRRCQPCRAAVQSYPLCLLNGVVIIVYLISSLLPLLAHIQFSQDVLLLADL